MVVGGRHLQMGAATTGERHSYRTAPKRLQLVRHRLPRTAANPRLRGDPLYLLLHITFINLHAHCTLPNIYSTNRC